MRAECSLWRWVSKFVSICASDYSTTCSNWEWVSTNRTGQDKSVQGWWMTHFEFKHSFKTNSQPCFDTLLNFKLSLYCCMLWTGDLHLLAPSYYRCIFWHLKSFTYQSKTAITAHKSIWRKRMEHSSKPSLAHKLLKVSAQKSESQTHSCKPSVQGVMYKLKHNDFNSHKKLLQISLSVQALFFFLDSARGKCLAEACQLDYSWCSFGMCACCTPQS